MIKDNAQALAELRADFGDLYHLGHDSDGTWWALRHGAGHAPFESATPDGLREAPRR